MPALNAAVERLYRRRRRRIMRSKPAGGMPITETATTPGAIPCKICSMEAPLYGTVDFNKSCVEVTGKSLPPTGVPIPYRRSPRCGFLFTTAFDHWDTAQFKQFIYNDEYVEVDPEYEEIRPRRNAE